MCLLINHTYFLLKVYFNEHLYLRIITCFFTQGWFSKLNTLKFKSHNSLIYTILYQKNTIYFC